MSDTLEVRLAPPGAGVPAIERFIGGRLLALRRWRQSREQTASAFESERGIIAELYQGRKESVLRTRVMIPRLRGLEDSSRYWSVLMTLDHLRIVNREIGRVIDSLSREIVPEGAASTAAVKPSPDVGPEVIGAYEASCDGLGSIVAASQDLRSRVRYAHPWFGPLDAAGWHVMAAVHMGIHRHQIGRILQMHPERTRETSDQA